MKVAYVFALPRAASYELGQMILPQLEAGVHGVDVVGMFFFDDNTFVLRGRSDRGAARHSGRRKRHPVDDVRYVALERGLAQGEPRWCDSQGRGRIQPAECQPQDVVNGVAVGCFPDLYAALAGNPPDQVITL